MTRRALALALLLAAMTGPAVAASEHYACTSFKGEPPATLDFALSYSSGAYAVLGAAFAVEGEAVYSTDPGDGGNVALVSAVEVAQDAEGIGFVLLDAEAGYDSEPVARIRLVTLSEGEETLTGGVLQVAGGGLWAIRCDRDDGR